MKRDQTAKVVTLRGGGEFQHRVMSMGVSIGGDIRLIQAADEGGNGAVVVRVGDTRLVLGHGMAEKVIVRPVA